MNLIRENNYDNLLSYINSKKYNSINIIGSPGSGKTTLSKKLSKKLGFKIINFDELFDSLSDGCKVLNQIEKSLCLEKDLIVDGTYTSLLSQKRLLNTDLFIFLSKNPTLCFLRVVKRNLINFNLFKNEKLSFKIIKVIFSFNLYYKKKLLSKIPSEKIIFLK
tara:strand:- start:35 stop:523 length:489 start_codon:yes stop_codon:yes gene_type:complete